MKDLMFGDDRQLQKRLKHLPRRSELVKPAPDTNVVAWLKKRHNFSTYKLGPNERLRDLEGDSVCYLDLSPAKTADPVTEEESPQNTNAA